MCDLSALHYVTESRLPVDDICLGSFVYSGRLSVWRNLHGYLKMRCNPNHNLKQVDNGIFSIGLRVLNSRHLVNLVNYLQSIWIFLSV